MDKISVIIPVHNAGPYIERCLDSLATQTHREIEIICVDDGSTDDSPGIITRYAQADPRFKVIAQENSGPAKARNAGLAAATGDYVMFCDSDDWYEAAACRKLWQTMTQWRTDLAMCDCRAVMAGGHANRRQDLPSHYLRLKGKVKLDNTNKIMVSALLWGKIFRKETIDRHGINFPDGYEHDDNAFIAQYLCVADSYFGVDEKLYNYVLRGDSIMDRVHTKKNRGKELDTYYSTRHIHDFLVRNGLCEKCAGYFLELTWYSLLFACRHATGEEAMYQTFYLYRPLISAFGKGGGGNYGGRRLFCLIDDRQYRAALAEVKGLLRTPGRQGGFFFARKTKPATEKYLVCGLPILVKKHDPYGTVYRVAGLPVYYRKKATFEPEREEPVEMQVFFSANDRFAPHLCVTLASILANAYAADRFHFHILDGGISAKNKRKIDAVKTIKDCRIEYLAVDEDLFENVPVGFHFSKQNWFRFLIPDIKPQLTKALYLDCDMVVTASLRNLWQADLRGCYVAAVADCHHAVNHLNVARYFNSGVLLINLRKWRQDGMVRKLFENIEVLRERILWADQDVMNYTFAGKVRFMHPRFNLQDSSYEPQHDGDPDMEDARRLPVIIHYTSEKKPWSRRFDSHPLWREYYRVLRATPYAVPGYCRHWRLRLKRMLFAIDKSAQVKKIRLAGLVVYKRRVKRDYRHYYILGLPVYRRSIRLQNRLERLEAGLHHVAQELGKLSRQLEDRAARLPEEQRRIREILNDESVDDDAMARKLGDLLDRMSLNKKGGFQAKENFRIALYSHQRWFGFNLRKLMRQAYGQGWLLLVCDPRETGSREFQAADLPGFRQARHQGINLYELTRYNLLMELGVADEEVNPAVAAHREALQRIFSNAMRFMDQAVRYIEYFQPEVIVMAQGYDLPAAVLRRLAVDRGLRIVALENTFDCRKLLWEDLAGITVNRNLAQNYYWRYKDQLPSELAQASVNRYLRSINDTKSDEHQSPSGTGAEPIATTLPIITYLAQVGVDASIMFGLRDFKSQPEIIACLAELAISQGFCLAVKLHPKERPDYVNVLPWYRGFTWAKLRQNRRFMAVYEKHRGQVLVDFNHRHNTYDLIARSKACVTINSQAGLEALLFGKEVVLCGHAYYGGLGFTHEAVDPESLRQVLTDLMRGRRSVNINQKPAKFFHIYRELYCLPKTEDSVIKLLPGTPDFRKPGTW
jgi:lipopolysaccharide biosynthesis glycosyltransferase/glycosyltransferase involved in cell wall biosynthesis